MPLSNADKRKAVMMRPTDANWLAYGDQAIAEHCHLLHQWVGVARASLVATTRENADQRA